MVIIFSIYRGFATSISLRPIELTYLLDFVCLWPLIFITTEQVDNSSSTCCSQLTLYFLLCSGPSLYVTIMFSRLSQSISTLYFLICCRFIILMLMFVERMLKWFIYLLIFIVVYEEIVGGLLLSCGK